jgi:hypothetical protein
LRSRVVIDGLEVILERLAADRDAMLDDLSRLAMGEGVALDRIRGVIEDAADASACRPI